MPLLKLPLVSWRTPRFPDSPRNLLCLQSPERGCLVKFDQPYSVNPYEVDYTGEALPENTGITSSANKCRERSVCSWVKVPQANEHTT